MPDFLDKLVGGFNKGVAKVSANSKALLEKQKLNSTINALENERKQLAQQLGMKVYEQYMDSDGEVGAMVFTDETAEFVNEIKARLEKIADVRAQIRLVDEAVADAVAAAEAKNEAKTEAKKQREAEAIIADEDMPGVICVCGAQNQENAKFCAKCGTQL
ncbi:MAG: zinc ribbon domain-containing protein [Defluviitaleaceae bacterium]|nr:zinc ribbon domain-containing protein [Defluviitaleaceae bacterium]